MIKHLGLSALVLALAGVGTHLHMAEGRAEAPYNIAAKARRVAAAIRSLDVILPEGRLLDLTDELAVIGIRPVDTVPDYPEKFTLPNRIYASSLPGNCGGVAIAAITEFGEDKYSVYLSVIWTNKNIIFDSGRFSYGEVIKTSDGEIIISIGELIKIVAEAQMERPRDGEACRSGMNFDRADRRIRHDLYLMQYSTDAPFNIAAKARRVAAATRGLDVVLPKGRLLDLTDELAAIGIRPVDAVPNYPAKFTFPTKIYASSLLGNCGGVAIAAITEPRDIHREQNLVYLSIVWNDEKSYFRSGVFSHEEVIELIAEAQKERQQGGC